MPTSVDELVTDRHTQMRFLEFLEAVARMAWLLERRKKAGPGGSLLPWRGTLLEQDRLVVALHGTLDRLLLIHKA